MNMMPAFKFFRPRLTSLIPALLILVTAGATHAAQPVGSATRAVQTIAIGKGQVTSGDQVLLGDEFAVGRYGTLTIQFNDESTLILTPDSRAKIVPSPEGGIQRNDTPSFVIQLNGRYRWISAQGLSQGRIESVEDTSIFTPPGNERQLAVPTRSQSMAPAGALKDPAPITEDEASAGDQESPPVAQPVGPTAAEKPPARNVKSKTPPAGPKITPAAQTPTPATAKKAAAPAVKSKPAPVSPKSPPAAPSKAPDRAVKSKVAPASAKSPAAQSVAPATPKKSPAADKTSRVGTPSDRSATASAAGSSPTTSTKPADAGEMPRMTEPPATGARTPGTVDSSPQQVEDPATPIDEAETKNRETASPGEPSTPQSTLPGKAVQPEGSRQPAASER